MSEEQLRALAEKMVADIPWSVPADLCTKECEHAPEGCACGACIAKDIALAYAEGAVTTLMAAQSLGLDLSPLAKRLART